MGPIRTSSSQGRVRSAPGDRYSLTSNKFNSMQAEPAVQHSVSRKSPQPTRASRLTGAPRSSWVSGRSSQLAALSLDEFFDVASRNAPNELTDIYGLKPGTFTHMLTKRVNQKADRDGLSRDRVKEELNLAREANGILPRSEFFRHCVRDSHGQPRKPVSSLKIRDSFSGSDLAPDTQIDSRHKTRKTTEAPRPSFQELIKAASSSSSTKTTSPIAAPPIEEEEEEPMWGDDWELEEGEILEGPLWNDEDEDDLEEGETFEEPPRTAAQIIAENKERQKADIYKLFRNRNPRDW